MGSSASLDRSPKKNWVEKAGELPRYVREVARSIEKKRGLPLSSAIPIAISQITKWAAGGEGVEADTVAKAQKALAQWEALKAKNKAKKNLSAREQLTAPVSEWYELQVAIMKTDMAGYDAIDPDDVEEWPENLDLSAPVDEVALFVASHDARLNLGVVNFDPRKHPRDPKGQFREILGGLVDGQSARLPDGLQVTRSDVKLDKGGTRKRYEVRHKNSTRGSAFYDEKGIDQAAKAALDDSARSRRKDSLGGEVSHRSADEAIKAMPSELKPGEPAVPQPDDEPGDERVAPADFDFPAAPPKKPADTKKTAQGGNIFPDDHVVLPDGAVKKVTEVGTGDVAGVKGPYVIVEGGRMLLQENVRHATEAEAQAEAQAGQVKHTNNDPRAGLEPAADADRFKIVSSKGGSGASPGQWTQHSTGDLEIEMPDNGPTARISEAEHDPEKPWTANVFPDGESNDSEQQHFESADEARKWVESKIDSGDIKPGGSGFQGKRFGADTEGAAVADHLNVMEDGDSFAIEDAEEAGRDWTVTKTGDGQYRVDDGSGRPFEAGSDRELMDTIGFDPDLAAEILDDEDKSHRLRDGGVGLVVPIKMGKEGEYDSRAIGKLDEGTPEAGTTDSHVASVLSAIDAQITEDDEDWDNQVRNLYDAVRHGARLDDLERNTLRDILDEDIQMSRENMDEGGDDEQKHIAHLEAVIKTLDEHTDKPKLPSKAGQQRAAENRQKLKDMTVEEMEPDIDKMTDEEVEAELRRQEHEAERAGETQGGEVGEGGLDESDMPGKLSQPEAAVVTKALRTAVDMDLHDDTMVEIYGVDNAGARQVLREVMQAGDLTDLNPVAAGYVEDVLRGYLLVEAEGDEAKLIQDLLKRGPDRDK